MDQKMHFWTLKTHDFRDFAWCPTFFDKFWTPKNWWGGVFAIVKLKFMMRGILDFFAIFAKRQFVPDEFLFSKKSQKNWCGHHGRIGKISDFPNNPRIKPFFCDFLKMGGLDLQKTQIFEKICIFLFFHFSEIHFVSRFFEIISVMWNFCKFVKFCDFCDFCENCDFFDFYEILQFLQFLQIFTNFAIFANFCKFSHFYKKCIFLHFFRKLHIFDKNTYFCKNMHFLQKSDIFDIFVKKCIFYKNSTFNRFL